MIHNENFRKLRTDGGVQQNVYTVWPISGHGQGHVVKFAILYPPLLISRTVNYGAIKF